MIGDGLPAVVVVVDALVILIVVLVDAVVFIFVLSIRIFALYIVVVQMSTQGALVTSAVGFGISGAGQRCTCALKSICLRGR